MSQPSFSGPGDASGLPPGGGAPGGGAPGGGGLGAAGRDERLAWFAHGAARAVPSGGLAEVLDDLAGRGWRYAGGTGD
ncbi:MAG TPA: hypothetical protein VG164_08320, partial [Trebonia sp.]|nr:hypothetical protein [Trebonia sp.]